MKRNVIVVRFVVDRRAARAILACAAVAALSLRLSSETLTVTTTYPAPVGVYNQIVTTGNSGAVPADTTLARNAGNVILAPASNAPGRVGVGTNQPQAKLDVAGTLRVGSFPADPPGAPGALYFSSSRQVLRLFTSGWSDLNGSPQGMFCGYASTPGLGAVVSVPCQGADISHGVCPAGFGPVSLGVGVSCLKS